MFRRVLEQRRVIFGLWILFGILPPAAFAHVKWFSNFSFLDRPLSLEEVVTPLFIGLLALSTIVLGILVFVDRKIEDLPLYQQVKNWLADRQHLSMLVLRIGMGITLILSWQVDTLLAPYLEINEALGWVQFILALLLIFPQTTPLSGAGIVGLWIAGVFEFGGFYMLDYLAFVGIGVYLMLGNAQNAGLKGIAIPALYFCVGFALIWPALEKLVYPAWGLEILANHPILTLGLPPEFFLAAAAFVELALGYILIIGLLGRPMGLIITLVFFTTTMIFGKVEVIGHTHLHAALIVFMLNGPGKIYPAPIDIHRKLGWRVAFAMVNFVLVTGICLVMYDLGSESTYQQTLTEALTNEDITNCQNDDALTITLDNDEEIPCEIVLRYTGS